MLSLVLTTQPTEYSPSANERRWLSGTARGNICSLASSPQELSGWRQVISFASRRCGPFHAAAPERCTPNRAAEYPHAPRTCSRWVNPDGTRSFIEPLSGIGGHPFVNTGCNLSLTGIGGGPRPKPGNLSHIIPESHCDNTPRDQTSRRALLYDLGCSVYGGAPHCTRRDKRGIGVCAGVETGYGPSIPALLGLYRQRACLEFDAIYGLNPAVTRRHLQMHSATASCAALTGVQRGGAQ